MLVFGMFIVAGLKLADGVILVVDVSFFVMKVSLIRMIPKFE